MQFLKKLVIVSILLGSVSVTHASVWSSAGNMTLVDPSENGWSPDQEEEEPTAPPDDSDDDEE